MAFGAIPSDLAALVTEYRAEVESRAYCGTTGGRIVLDHIIPKSRGVADTADNLAPACDPCNSRKAARLGWVTMDGRTGAYDPETGPLLPVKRRRRVEPRPTNAFKDHSGSGFL